MTKLINKNLRKLSTDELSEALQSKLALIERSSPNEETRQILHELQVHQIELEMQKRELQESQKELELSHNRYMDLYDFAPVGYVSLNASGCIQEINLTAAILTGKERAYLISKPLIHWLKPENPRLFFKHLNETFTSKKKVVDELIVQTVTNGRQVLRFESIVSSYIDEDAPPYCRTALVDVTESRRAEQELRNREQHLQVITDNSPILIAYADDSQRILFSNKLFSQWSNVDPHQSLNIHLKDVIGKSEYKKIESHIKSVLNGNTSVFESLLNFTTAGIRHVEVNCVPDTEGNVIKGFFLFINDISRYKDIEAALTKQRDLAQNLLRTAQDIVLVLDTEGKIVRVNPYFEKLTGYTADQVEGKDWFTTFISKRDQDRLTKVFHAAIKDGKASGTVNPIVTKDGRKPLIDWYSTTLKDENGKTTGVLYIGYDITDRRHMELALRDRDRQLVLLTDALPVLIAYIDKHEHYQFVNKAFEEWFGLSRSQIERQSVRSVLGDAAYEKIEGHIKLVLLGEKLQYEGIMPFLHGDERYVIAHFIPHLNDNGKIKGYMTLVTDISEFKQLEEKNRQQQLELARISRIQTIGEMASTLAHELNQPLSAISSYALASLRLFESESITKGELREVLEALSAQAQRAGEIIRGIRRLIKKEEAQRQWLDINKVTQEVVQFCDAEARQHNVKIVLDLQPSLPPVFADEIQLQQVILNLIRNGIEAMADHTPDSRELIATSKVDKNVVVAISDNGPGLQPEIIDGLFSPLTTTKSFGLGLGLAISRTIIEQHEGKLWWKNNAEKGATFSFSLPTSSNDNNEKTKVDAAIDDRLTLKSTQVD